MKEFLDQDYMLIILEPGGVHQDLPLGLKDDIINFVKLFLKLLMI